MSSTSLNEQGRSRLGFMDTARRLSSEWGPQHVADLSSACASRSALLAVLDEFPEARPEDKAVANAQSLVWDMVDEAECFILDQTPVTTQEAVSILDVILDGEPQRSDSRDHDALRRIRDLLRSGS